MVVVRVKHVAQKGGYIMVFTPQPLNTRDPTMVFSPLSEGISVKVRLAPDRLANIVIVWWVDAPPGRGFSRHGFGTFDLNKPGAISCEIKHIGGTVVNTITFAAGIGVVSPVECKQCKPSVHQKVVDHHLITNQSFWGARGQLFTNLDTWIGVPIELPGCRIPSWAFLLEYAHPVSSASNNKTLMRLLQVAQHRLGLTSDEVQNAHKWPDVVKSELMCEMATTLARMGTYHLDTLTTDPTPMDAMWAGPFATPQKRVTPIDQWVHPLLFNSVSNMEFDCEDGASTIYYVARLLQTIKLDSGINPAYLSTGLAVIVEFSQRYEFFFSLGTLFLPCSNSYTHHAWVVAFDQRLTPIITANQSPPAKNPRGGYLPMLNLESTAYTTSTPGFDQRSTTLGSKPVDLLGRYHRLSSQSSLSAKIPYNCTSSDKQYKTIHSLCAPHLWQQDRACEWCPVTDQLLGVSMKHVDVFWRYGIKFLPVNSVSSATMNAVRGLLAMQPRCRGLPTVKGHQPFRPIPTPHSDRVMISIGSAREWNTDQRKDTLTAQCKRRGVDSHWLNIHIAHGCEEVELLTND